MTVAERLIKARDNKSVKKLQLLLAYRFLPLLCMRMGSESLEMKQKLSLQITTRPRFRNYFFNLICHVL